MYILFFPTHCWLIARNGEIVQSFLFFFFFCFWFQSGRRQSSACPAAVGINLAEVMREIVVGPCPATFHHAMNKRGDNTPLCLVLNPKLIVSWLLLGIYFIAMAAKRVLLPEIIRCLFLSFSCLVNFNVHRAFSFISVGALC